MHAQRMGLSYLTQPFHLTAPGSADTIASGRGCVPVDALVFKISGRWRRAGCGGFDSHAFPPRFTSTFCPQPFAAKNRQSLFLAGEGRALRPVVELKGTATRPGSVGWCAVVEQALKDQETARFQGYGH